MVNKGWTMKLLFRYIMYHLWEWRHRKKVKVRYIPDDELKLHLDAAKRKTLHNEFQVIRDIVRSESTLSKHYKPEDMVDIYSIRYKSPDDIEHYSVTPVDTNATMVERYYVVDKLLEDITNSLQSKGYKIKDLRGNS